MPSNEDARQEMLDLLDKSDEMTSAGFGYLSGRRMGAASGDEQTSVSDQDSRKAFEDQLQLVENLIRQRGGPFMMG